MQASEQHLPALSDSLKAPNTVAPDGYFKLVIVESPFRSTRREVVAPVGTPLRSLVEEQIGRTLDDDLDKMLFAVNDGPTDLETGFDVTPKSGDLIILRMVPGIPLPVIIGLFVTSAVLQIAGYATGNQTLMYIGAGVGLLAMGAGYASIGATLTAAQGAKLLGWGSLGLGAANLIGSLIAPQPSIQQNVSPEIGDSHYLKGTGNNARPWGPIPTVLGRVTFAPPLGGQQHNEAVGEANWLRATFCVGYGPVEINPRDIRIGGTSIVDNYPESEYEMEIREGFPGDADKQLYDESVGQQEVNQVLISTGNPTEGWTATYVRDVPDITVLEPSKSKTGRLTSSASLGDQSIDLGLVDRTSQNYNVNYGGPFGRGNTSVWQGSVKLYRHYSTSSVSTGSHNWYSSSSIQDWIYEDQPGALVIACHSGDELLVQLDDNTWQEVTVSSAPSQPDVWDPTYQTIVDNTHLPHNGASLYTRWTRYFNLNMEKAITITPALEGDASANRGVIRVGGRWQTFTTAQATTSFTVKLHNPDPGMRYQNDNGSFAVQENVISIWHRTSAVGQTPAGRWVASGCAGDSSWTDVASSQIRISGTNIEQKDGFICGMPSTKAIVWSGETTNGGFADIEITGLPESVYDIRVGIGAHGEAVDNIGWDPGDPKNFANVNWVGIGTTTLTVTDTLQKMASVSLYLKATDERQGTIGDLTVRCEKLLPFYKKGAGSNNGSWTSPHPVSVKGRLKGSYSSTDTTLSVRPGVVVKCQSSALPLSVGDQWIYIGGATPANAQEINGFGFAGVLEEGMDIIFQVYENVWGQTAGILGYGGETDLSKYRYKVARIRNGVTLDEMLGNSPVTDQELGGSRDMIVGQNRNSSLAHDGWGAATNVAIKLDRPLEISSDQGAYINGDSTVDGSGNIIAPYIRSDTSLVAGGGGLCDLVEGDPIRILINPTTQVPTGSWHETTVASVTIPDPGDAEAIRIVINDGLPGDAAGAYQAGSVPPFEGVLGIVEQSRTPFKTQSPAWSFAEILRGSGQPTPISDSLLDADSLRDWHDMTLDPAGDGSQPQMLFNAVIDFRETAFDLCTKIASSARASVNSREGRIGVIYDRDRSAESPVQLFTPRNTIKGSLMDGWAYVDPPHAYRVRYPDDTGKSREHLIYQSGYSRDGSGGTTVATTFDEISAWGVTNGDSAYAYALYQIQQMIYRNESIELSTDIEGLIAERGDLVLLSDELDFTGIAWGRVTSLTVGSPGYYSEMVIDEPVEYEYSVGTNYRARVRRASENDFPEYEIANLSSGATIFNTRLPFQTEVLAADAPSIGDIVTFGTNILTTRRMIVQSTVIDSDLNSKVLLVPEAQEIFSALDSQASSGFPSPTEVGVGGTSTVPEIGRIYSMTKVDGSNFRRVTVSATVGVDGTPEGESYYHWQWRLVSQNGLASDWSTVEGAWVANVSNPFTTDHTFIGRWGSGDKAELRFKYVLVRHGQAGHESWKEQSLELFRANEGTRPRGGPGRGGFGAAPVVAAKSSSTVRSVSPSSDWFAETPHISHLRLEAPVGVDANTQPTQKLSWSLGTSIETESALLTGDTASVGPYPSSWGNLVSTPIESWPSVNIEVFSGSRLLRSDSWSVGADGRVGWEYTIEKAIADGGPFKSLRFDLTPVLDGITGLTKSVTYENAPHPAPSVTLSQVSGGVEVSIPQSFVTSNLQTDFVGIIVCADQVSGFTPSEGNIRFMGKVSDRILVPVSLAEPVTWYFKVAAYDKLIESYGVAHMASVLDFNSSSIRVVPQVQSESVLVADFSNVHPDPILKYSGEMGVMHNLMTANSPAQYNLPDGTVRAGDVSTTGGWSVCTAENSITPVNGAYMLRHHSADTQTGWDTSTGPSLVVPRIEGSVWGNTPFDPADPDGLDQQQGLHVKAGEKLYFSFMANRTSGSNLLTETSHGTFSVTFYDSDHQMLYWDPTVSANSVDFVTGTLNIPAGAWTKNSVEQKVPTGTVTFASHLQYLFDGVAGNLVYAEPDHCVAYISVMNVDDYTDAGSTKTDGAPLYFDQFDFRKLQLEDTIAPGAVTDRTSYVSTADQNSAAFQVVMQELQIVNSAGSSPVEVLWSGNHVRTNSFSTGTVRDEFFIRRCSLSTTQTSGGGAGTNTVTVADSTGFDAGDTIAFQAISTAYWDSREIQSVNHSTNVITVTVNFTGFTSSGVVRKVDADVVNVSSNLWTLNLDEEFVVTGVDSAVPNGTWDYQFMSYNTSSGTPNIFQATKVRAGAHYDIKLVKR